MKNTLSICLLAMLFASCSKTEVPQEITPPVVTPPVVVGANPTFTAISKTSGATGDALTLTGTGFSTVIEENEVKFSGATANAKITAASATSLTVEVPAGATTGVITIKVKTVAASLAAGFNATFTVNPVVVTPVAGNGTLILRDNLKTHLHFAANDSEGNFYTINTTGPSHDYYKVLRIDASGAITKTFEPADFGGANGTNLRINGMTNDFDGNVYVAVGLSTFRYTKSEGRLYVITKGSDKPTLVRNIIGKDLEYFDVSEYFDDMVINSKKELFITDNERIYHVPTSGVVTPYIDDQLELKATNFLSFTGLAIDKNDNLYFTAVNGNGFINNIYKADAAKTITQLYTANSFGFADGALATAKFDAIGSLAIDAAGTQLYIADGKQFRLRKLDLATKMVTTIAGTGKTISLIVVNGVITVNASGPALESTTQPAKISLSEKQKTIYLQNPNDSYYQLYKY